MVYYAPAMIMSLAMAYFLSTEYELPNGAKIRMLKNFRTAFLVLLPLTFIAAFRWEVGSDTWYGASYTQAYHAAKDGENIREFEPLFYLLTRLVAMLDLPFFWYVFILSIVYMVCVSYAFSKGSISPVWTIIVYFLLYIFFDSFSALRQGVAEGFIIIALSLMLYMPASIKKDIIILLLIVAATLFHTLAFVFIPIYFICRIRFSRLGLLKVAAIGILAYPILQVVLSFLNRFIDKGGEYKPNGVALVNLILSLAIFALCWYFYDSISELDENAYMFINISLIIFIFMVNSGALLLAFRYFDMFKTAYLFLVPLIIKGVKTSRLRLLIKVVLLMVFILWFINAFYIQANYASDYHSVFENWEKYSNLP